jgi:hypothetical protein
MNKPSKPAAVRPVAVNDVRDVRALQRRVRAFAGSGTLTSTPTSYHR